MPLVNTSVPNLIQGVSQQPDATRFAGQCEEQENALSSVADGLKKRPNTRHIAKLLTSAIGDDSFVHFINRSETEKYVVMTYREFNSSGQHTGCKLRAFNLSDGTEASITAGGVTYNSSFLSMLNPSTSSNYTQSEIDADPNKSATSYTINSSNTPYLHANNPRADLEALTIADTTLILNTKKTVLGSSLKTASLAKQALVTIIQGGYEKDYTVDVNIKEKVPISSSNIAGYVAPQFSFVTQPYSYDSGTDDDEEGTESHDWEIYRHRIVAVNIINNGGVNVPSNYTISVTSNYTIYTPATFNVTVEDGVVTNVDVTNGGDFAGTPQSVTQYSNLGNSTGTMTGHAAPQISLSSQGGFTTTTIKALNATGTTFSSSGGNDGNANTNLAATRLSNNMGVNFDEYFSKTVSGNSILLTLLEPDAITDDDFTETTGAEYDFDISSSDSLGNTGMSSVYKTTSSISDLPVVNQNGFSVKIVGDAELAQDDYYIKFETANGAQFGEGAYVETVAPDIIKGLDASTMPHSLINFGLNQFELKETGFLDRVAGDDNSNPLPSFVGHEIKGIFFFKNRIGFLSGDHVVMSESGLGGLNEFSEFVYNFGRTSVSSLLDSDPIDASVATNSVTNLKSAKGFQENLILFSENGQFVLKGGDVLTPKTVAITPITNFSFEDQVDPLPLGSYIYFPFTRGNFTGMREFTVNANTDNYDSTEVTEHVPAYIPKNIIDMAGTTSEDMIVLLSGDEKGSLYIYNYFWNNNQKVLSAWSKFTFTGEIRGVEFTESTLYAVITNNGETNLVEMPLESGLTDTAGFVTHLDMRVASTVTNGNDTITLPYTPADNSVEVYTTDGLKLNATNSGATVTLAQAVTADTDVFVGIPYTMKYTFSEQIFKAQAGQGKSPSPVAKMMLRNGAITFDKTAFFKVKVTPQFRNTFENIFTPTVVGSSTLGSLELETGSYRFPVFTKAEDTTITIENASALPSNFQSAEFESFVHSRSNRIA